MTALSIISTVLSPSTKPVESSHITSTYHFTSRFDFVHVLADLVLSAWPALIAPVKHALVLDE